MTEQTAVIELGVPAPSGLYDPLPTLSAGVRRRRWRAAATVFAALCCLGLTAAGAVPAPLHGGFTLTLPGGWYEIGTSAIYLPTGEREITARDLGDGHVLWRATLPEEVQFLQMLGGDMPVAVSDHGACSTLTLLDPATGQARWTYQGMFIGEMSTAAPALWILRGPTNCAEADPWDGTQAGVIDLVDRESGAVRTSVQLPANAQWLSTHDVPTFAIWDDRGNVVERNVESGAVVVSGSIPALAKREDIWADTTPQVLLLGHSWVILNPPSMTIGDTDVTIGAYGRSTLDPLWTVKVPGSMADVREYYGLSECEPTILCVQLGEAEQIRLDTETGTRLPDTQTDGEKIGDHWSLVQRGVMGGDFAVVRDDRTGRIVFPSWRMYSLVREDAAMVILTRVRGRSTEFGAFDAHTGRLRELGATPGIFSRCDAVRRALLCVDDLLVLHVWPMTHLGG